MRLVTLFSFTFATLVPQYPTSVYARDENEFKPQLLKGTWIVSYGDLYLGVVKGKARVDENESSAEVVLKDPKTGQEYKLTSSSFKRQGKKITIVFEGASPSGRREDGMGLPEEPVVVSEETRKIKVSYRDSEAEQGINARKSSDLDKVTVELEEQGWGKLVGSWHYQADPVTQRDRNGGGRCGVFELQEDGTGKQLGGEVWLRPRPIIYGAFAINDQLKIENGVPAYEHPFKPGSRGFGETREILIFGEELPQEYDEPVEIISESEHIKYANVRKKSHARDNPITAELFAQGKEKLLAGLPEYARDRAGKHDFIVVRADLQDGVLPGYHTFTLNGVQGGWKLEFGDNSARIDFVRDLRTPVVDLQGKNFERSNDFFLPETIRVRVTTALELDVEEINVAVGSDGKACVLSGEPVIAAKKVAGLKNTYVTGPINIVRGAADPEKGPPYEIPGKPGTVFRKKWHALALLALTYRATN